MFLPNPGVLAAGVISVAIGQAMWTTPGQHLFVVPDGVTSISAVCIGKGGDANTRSGNGGALAWRNAIPVTPGETLTLWVSSGETSVYRGGLRLVGALDGNASTTPATVLAGSGYAGGLGASAGSVNQRNGGGAGGYGGAGGAASTESSGYGGSGSSPYGGSGPGGAAGANTPYLDGGMYGGGAGSSRGAYGIGGPGCIRIIWGPDRAFPNTNTGDL